MKKQILLYILTLGMVTSSYSQEFGWTDISENIPGTPDLSDVFFVSDDEGWITSSSHAEIYHTTDGGETFEVQTTQLACNAIHMLNENTGYAGGNSGFIYKTTDGGINWIFHGTTAANLTDISFPTNGNIGYSCGINGNIWSIDNTGVTKMTSNINGDLSSISFPINSSYGKVCGGSVISTYVNGIWGGASNSYPSGTYNTIFMADTLFGWAAGDNGAIIHTSDGQNWATQQTNPAYILTDVFFVNTQEGWVVGSGGGIFHTINGGAIWNIEGVELSSSILRGVHFTSPTNGYVVGNNKTLLKYTEVSGIGYNKIPIDFEVFPNPVHKNLFIKCSDLKTENGNIQILSIDGKEVLKKEIRQGSENIEIDVSHLETGMYLCKISTNNKSSTKKLIIE
jgi:photosystem II stability/assembly factor-like uncharacterized protein